MDVSFAQKSVAGQHRKACNGGVGVQHIETSPQLTHQLFCFYFLPSLFLTRYNAAKGAVHQLTKCSALDLGQQGIRVNSVSPGWVWTREVEKAADGDRAKWEPVWGDFHMLGRLSDTVEVAKPIMFLLSDEASFITGTDLAVDGGYCGLGPEGLGKTSKFAGSD